MLRVLTLSTLYPDASRPDFGPFVEYQTRGLAAHPDVDLRVMVPWGAPPLIGRLIERYRMLDRLPRREHRNGVTVYRMPFAHLPVVGARFDAKLLAWSQQNVLKSLHEDFPFDVIDAEFFWPDGPAAIALGKALGVPVSIKARGADIHYWGKNPATAAQVIAAGQAADGMLAVSAALKADMVALGMPDDRIMVHYTGIDRTRFHVRDRAMAKAALGISGPVLVSVGALIPRKRHAIVIDAMKRVPDVTLVIIGQGTDRAALEAQAASLGARIRFLGSQPHDVIADWLAAADAMVLMSASEGLANAWVEALASGTPVVISDVGGAREVLDRPEAGVLATPDPASVADAIQQVLARDADRHAVAATVGRFSWEANTKALFDHLSALV
jgi:teichuronic acid biosynthesis glycosyltransferase TuaC